MISLAIWLSSSIVIDQWSSRQKISLLYIYYCYDKLLDMMEGYDGVYRDAYPGRGGVPIIPREPQLVAEYGVG